MLNAYGGGYAPPMLQFGAPPSNAAPRGASPNLALDFRGGILAAHGHEQAEETMREPSADGSSTRAALVSILKRIALRIASLRYST